MNLHDIEILEGNEADEMEQAEAMQRAINGGSAWSFQGSYGRAMMDALKSGVAMLGKHSARDYYGNYIPARDEVKAGTFGSYEFVVERMGQDYADRLAAL